MDLILHSGKIRTMDPKNPLVEAVAIKNGRIHSIGNSEEILRYRQKKTEVIDLKGKMVLPGFNDSHMHLVLYGSSLQRCKLRNVKNIPELIHTVQGFIKEQDNKGIQWIMGDGWNQDHFEEKRYPTKEDLDKISTEVPICLIRACLHMCVVNSKALELAGVTKESSQVEGGYFDIGEGGAPNGIFRENALKLIYNKIPIPSEEDIEKMILDASRIALSKGITSVHSDDFRAIPGKNFADIIKGYRNLNSQEKLPVRVYEQCLLPSIDDFNSFISQGYATGQGDEFFKLGPLKLLSDGSLGARTAALREGYADLPTTKGILIYNKNELTELIWKAHCHNMSVAVHGIGDEAMYMIFDCIENVQRMKPNPQLRHGIIHCQITDEYLIEEFKRKNVIAYIQPIFLDYDIHIVEQRLGKQRAEKSYNWKTMVDKGINVAFSSDCPVESLDVLPGIYTAITRKDLNGYPEKGWLPQERLTLDQALYAYTMGSAYAAFEENIKGSISPGKLGDLIVLSQDLYSIEPEDMKEVIVEMTFIGGELRYSREGI